MAEKVISHFCHEHPLILTENVGNKERVLNCYGCHKPVFSESAYVCHEQDCSSTAILHKGCGELPRQVLHPSHPQHPLHLFHRRTLYSCHICLDDFEDVLRYRCVICDFDIHISCAIELFGNLDLLEEKRLQHKSHHHPLTLTRKPPSLFYCDGCGTEGRDMAYICSTCEFWIHKSCASLPTTIQTNHHHHHELSLAFCFPSQYRDFIYNCDICHKEFLTTCWVYYCGDCTSFAHVKCATSTKATIENIPAESSDLNTENHDHPMIQLPAHDYSKELITPFIIRENVFDKIPDIKDLPASISTPKTTASVSMLFNYHKHPLSLVSGEGPANDDELMMICDVCVTHIYSPPYYTCVACKYFVHSSCHFLPKTLSYPVSQLGVPCRPTRQNHKLIAYSSSKFHDKGLLFCALCKLLTNGMVYECQICMLRMDVKCASLPTIIKHASHPQHKLIKIRVPKEKHDRTCGCGFRVHYIQDDVAYYCTSDYCEFALHWRCVLMPQSIKHEWDKHPLLLTYDTSVDHPSTDFYCEICEGEMDPKKWMYHCHECNHSFHTHCLMESSWSRNIKFGRQFEFDHRLHPHPLTFNQVTLKLSCDPRHIDLYDLYNYPKMTGFECASCNYVICYFCGLDELEKM